jgi:hypothetical protein
MQFRRSETHNLEDAKEVVRVHNDLAEEQPSPVLADIRAAAVGADREARTYYTTEEAARLKTAMAMVVDSPLQRMLGNFFLRLNRPPYPTRLFADQEAALSWLQDYLPSP